MSLVCIASQEGSPGATTASLLLTGLWPRSSKQKVLVEADPSGGTLAGRYHLSLDPDLSTLAKAVNSGIGSRRLWRHTQLLPGSTKAVVSPPKADDVQRILEVDGSALGQWFDGLDEVDVFVDIGRLDLLSPLQNMLTSASSVLMVARPVSDQLRLGAERLREIEDSVDHVAWVLIGDAPYCAKEVEVAYGLPVLAVLADDPKSASALLTGTGVKQLADDPLVETGTKLVEALSSELANLDNSAPEPEAGTGTEEGTDTLDLSTQRHQKEQMAVRAVHTAAADKSEEPSIPESSATQVPVLPLEQDDDPTFVATGSSTGDPVFVPPSLVSDVESDGPVFVPPSLVSDVESDGPVFVPPSLVSDVESDGPVFVPPSLVSDVESDGPVFVPPSIFDETPAAATSARASTDDDLTSSKTDVAGKHSESERIAHLTTISATDQRFNVSDGPVDGRNKSDGNTKSDDNTKIGNSDESQTTGQVGDATANNVDVDLSNQDTAASIQEDRTWNITTRLSTKPAPLRYSVTQDQVPAKTSKTPTKPPPPLVPPSKRIETTPERDRPTVTNLPAVRPQEPVVEGRDMPITRVIQEVGTPTGVSDVPPSLLSMHNQHDEDSETGDTDDSEPESSGDGRPSTLLDAKLSTSATPADSLPGYPPID